jgi:putative ABC transport system ATP-binding protein
MDTHPMASSDSAPVLQLRSLTKTYGDDAARVEAVKEVTLSVKRGEFVSIAGQSGSGKSTLLHCVAGLEVPSGGDIVIEDVRILELNEEQRTIFRRRNIGVVFQFFNLLPDLDVRENVCVPMLLDGLPSREVEERAADALNAVGLTGRVKHTPGELSGGEMQRVAIARALAMRPSLLLADEPTGNLDSENGAVILDLLREACSERGQTTVMVTHDANAAARADRQLVMADGRLVQA